MQVHTIIFLVKHFGEVREPKTNHHQKKEGNKKEIAFYVNCSFKFHNYFERISSIFIGRDQDTDRTILMSLVQNPFGEQGGQIRK